MRVLVACQACGYPFDHDALGRHGCPNCFGEGIRRTVVDPQCVPGKMGTIKAATTADATRREKMENTKVQGAVRIGRTGTKLHPAYSVAYTDARGRVRYGTSVVTCGCPHSNNRIGGPAFHFIPGASKTCGN